MVINVNNGMRHMNKKIYISLILIILIVFGWGLTRDRYVYLSGDTMGTIYNIKIRNNNINNQLNNKIKVLLESVNRQFSLFDESSELSKLNNLSVGEKQEISQDMYKLLSEVVEISDMTMGSFDITVAPLVNYWGFGKQDRDLDQLFNDDEVNKKLSFVGMDNFSVFAKDDKYYFVKYSEIELDLGAVAKGYGVDKIADLLISEGMSDFVVEIGGEVKAIGDKSGKETGWNIGVLVPSYNNEQGYSNVVNIKNMAVATSGDYRNYFEYDGKRYSHMINPKTGFPVINDLASVSVIDEDCFRADAIATALMVMGKGQAIKWVNDNDIVAFLNVRNGDDIIVELSDKAKGI